MVVFMIKTFRPSPVFMIDVRPSAGCYIIHSDNVQFLNITWDSSSVLTIVWRPVKISSYLFSLPYKLYNHIGQAQKYCGKYIVFDFQYSQTLFRVKW